MNCNEFDEKISLSIDGKLDKDEEKDFLDHSIHCQRCKTALENTKKMIDSFEDLKHMKAPEDLSTGIIQALELEMGEFAGEESQESPKESPKENVQEDEHENVRKVGHVNPQRKKSNGWLSKQSPQIKRISLAAVLVLIVSSAVILTADWLPSPIEKDMVDMESAEESSLDERAADDSGDAPDSIENREAEDLQDGPEITNMEENEEAFGDEPSSEEGLDQGGIDGEHTILETEEKETFGIKYGEWIVLLLGIGVISVIVVFRKNRRS